MTTRRAARNQPLPEQEAAYLNTLSHLDLYSRCKALYDAGWTLRAIGDALYPARSRSTVRSWISRPDPYAAPNPSAPKIVEPNLKTPAVYVRRRKPSPGISPTDLGEIITLAPVARRYRAGMSSLHTAALANKALTDIVTRLHADGVSVQELADAAHVTYRAMARRLGKTK
jgi:hypothetical protein